MSNQNISLTYDDYHEGELAFVSELGQSVVEVNNERVVTVKIYLPVTLNWKRLAFLLRSEIKEIRDWMYPLCKFGKKPEFEFEDWVYENVEYEENDKRVRNGHPDSDKRVHLLFYKYGSWRMYENDDHYLFIWQGSADSFNGMEYEFNDSSYWPIRFVEKWWQRVHGFPEEEENEE